MRDFTKSIIFKSILFSFIAASPRAVFAQQLFPVVPDSLRGRIDAERMGTHDANNIRTMFYNFGMVGDYPADPGNVDLSVFHSVEVPKGSGMDYSDGITPFVLAKIYQTNNVAAYIMETGYRERQGTSPNHVPPRIMRFEPRPGFFQPDPAINVGRSPAVSDDSRTWPAAWPDKASDPSDPGWPGSWDGYFGKRPAADEESYTVMDDNFYDAWKYYPDSRDSTRRGLGLKVEVRGFQWANPQSQNVIFWHYDISDEGTVTYNNNVIFGLYMDSGVGGSALSCDGVYESDDDDAYYDNSFGLNLVYTWDLYGHGVDLTSNCGVTGYLGYAYLETPGNSTDGIDNDQDGITDESRSSGPGNKIVGKQEIMNYAVAHYDTTLFSAHYGPIEGRPAYRAGVWWTGDEDMDWVAQLDDVGADGVPNTHDIGEGDGVPTAGEPNFDQTDIDESDQIGLTGFKMNRIRAGANNPGGPTDNIVFFTDQNNWPQRLYDMWTSPIVADRFDQAVVLDYNIGFLFASGTFVLKAGTRERFSLALAYGADLNELRRTVKIVQLIYNANYQFAVPPPLPTLTAEPGDGYVRLSWDDAAEKGIDPITNLNDFEGYKIYRSTDPEFTDPRVVTNARGTGPIGNGRPIAQFDLKDGIEGYSNITVEGTAFYLGNETGITHTFVDTTVTNGQDYYYAVCAYNYGSDSLGYYPSENSIAVSRTVRGGTILPKNVVEVRPNPKTLGLIPAAASQSTHVAGTGNGTLQLSIVNSDIVPNQHLYVMRFRSSGPDSIRAEFYDVRDSTAHTNIVTGGTDFAAAGTGPVGEGILPLVWSQPDVSVDSASTKYLQRSGASVTDLVASYEQSVLPVNYRRPGYPGNVTITFSNVPLDTSLPRIPTGSFPREPVYFRAVAHTDSGDVHLPCYFYDPGKTGKLDGATKYIQFLTYDKSSGTQKATWHVQLDTTGLGSGAQLVPPTLGDVFQIGLKYPLTPADTFTYSSTAQYIDPSKAKLQFAVNHPYVVPNPYVASASFEPAPFAVFGRGERRIEFRSLPQKCVIRIYTVKGELVQTLNHQSATSGIEPWDLRTRDNLDIAPGLYIFQVDGGAAGTYVGKFAIIK